MSSLSVRDSDTLSGSRFGIGDSQFHQIFEILRRNSLIKEAIVYGSRAKGVYTDGPDIDLVLKGDALTLKDLNRTILALDDLLLPYTFDVSLYHHIDNQDLIDHIERIGQTISRVREGWLGNGWRIFRRKRLRRACIVPK